MSLLEPYKNFVKQHPQLVLNAERLLHWVTYWDPERFSGSEYTYEAFSAAVGLLGIYNESILAEHPDYNATVAKWSFWLAAVEQVQTLVELRAIQLEQRGKMSRYVPLVVLELIKTVLRMRLWRSSKCTLALEAVSREDQEQHECEQQLKDLLQALTRLRQRHCCGQTEIPTQQQVAWKEELTRAQAVRAAAVAPYRPPAACAAGLAGTAVLPAPGMLHTGNSSTSSGNDGSSSSSSRCPCCGAVCGRPAAAAAAAAANGSSSGEEEQQQHCCQHCGRTSHHQRQQQQQQQHGISSSNSHSHALNACTTDQPSSCMHNSSSDSSSKLAKGWWQRITSLYPSSTRKTSHRSSGSEVQQQEAEGDTTRLAGALPGSWAPALRPQSSSSSSSSAFTRQRSNCCRPGAASFSFHSRQQQQLLQALPWCLSNRDCSIGHAVMWAGELAHVLRPLVYVCLLKRYGITSWKPWVYSLALDLASGYGLHTGHAILCHSNASRWPAGSTLYSLALLRSLSSSKWSPGEQQELLMRRVQLLRYLLRSPCYNAITRRLLLKVVAGSRWMPGLSNLAEFAFNMVEGMQSYYTYVES